MRPLRGARPLAPERAWDYALDLLTRRAATAAEVAERLRRRGLDADRADAIVARLTELRLLDDRAFAAAYVRRRREERGRFALRGDLTRKGVDEAVVERALAGDDGEAALDDAQQRAAAAALLAKHAWRFVPRPAVDEAAPPAARARAEADARRRVRARAASFLARRGFGPEAVADALGDAFGERDATDAPDVDGPDVA